MIIRFSISQSTLKKKQLEGKHLNFSYVIETDEVIETSRDPCLIFKTFLKILCNS